MLGKFPKSFLTLPPRPASSVNCQNITLATDGKGVVVVSHLTGLTAVSGSSKQAQDLHRNWGTGAALSGSQKEKSY